MKTRKVKFTEDQKHRALVKLARRYGEWNTITDNDESTRNERKFKMHDAVWKVIEKMGVKNEYFLATNDIRAKKT